MNPRTTLDGTHPPARPRSSLRLACLAMLLCTCQVLFASAWAAGPPIAAKGARAATSAVAELPVEAPPLPQPDELRKQLDAIPSKITEDADARTLLSQLSQISALARQIVKQRTEELADVDSRLAGLGPTPEGGSPADAPDVAEQRSTLNKQRTAVDSDLKLARLIDVDAEQRSADILRQRREQFQAALTARVDSPLSPLFWRQWKSGAYGDLLLLQELAGDLRMAIGEATSAPRKRNNFILQLLGALALLVGGTWMAERILVRVLPTRLPSGRLRRTLMAAAAVILNVLIVTLAVKLMWNGIRVNAQPDERLRMLESICVEMAAYASYVIALGHALLSNRRPSWRLLPISDHMARQLGPFPWWFALSSALGGVATKVSGLAGLSISSEVLVLIIFSLAIAAITLASLRHLRDLPAAEAAGEDGASSCGDAGKAPVSAEPPARPWWFGLLAVAAGIALIAIVASIVLGFVALAATMSRQLVWSIVVVSTMYLLFKLADDLCGALLSSKGSIGSRMQEVLGLDAALLDQACVLASGLLRVVLFFYMVIALLAPFGTSPDEVFRRGSSLDHDLKIGEFTIAPQALLTAVATMVLGFFAIYLLKRWLTHRYFPSTSLEPGMRSSITTLLGYVCGVVVIAAALAGLGISVERIAWVASALSVGIGFGLQAIVQNFISGLILLAERPVRVGDWVMLGDTEGDVRRVNVRATEIQLFDRSTMIVPNSEFITKSVRNMTLSGTPGRVLMRLPAPLDTDTELMREIILRAYAEHPAIQETPAPIVQLEGIQSGTLTFLAIGYIGNPRNTGGVRSDLLFTILKALREAGLYLSPPATTSVPRPEQPSGSDAVVDQLTGRG